MSGGDACNKDLLTLYYTRVFPTNLFYQWLSYKATTASELEAGKENAGKEGQQDGAQQLAKKKETASQRDPSEKVTSFDRREFSLTVLLDNGEEAYFRFRCYKSASDFSRDLVQHTPIKLDIGAVYNIPVNRKDTNQGSFKPEQKELVFDIDMTDYDDIRTCCEGAKVCRKCWLFMNLALKVLDRALREDFGFSNLMWVFSGRRGIHCWIADPRARRLTPEGRGAVADYLHIVTGSDQNAKRVSLNQAGAAHPHVVSSYEEIRRSFWPRLLQEQNMFAAGSKHVGRVMNYIPDVEVRNQVEQWVAANPKFDSTKFFDTLETGLLNCKNPRRANACQEAVKEIVLAYSYPRLDINVSKGMNHLLKAPFCVHPKTGNICVPIDPRQSDAFNPLAVPTLGQLINELNETEDDKALPKSIKPHVDLFKSFVNGAIQAVSIESREVKQKRGDLSF